MNSSGCACQAAFDLEDYLHSHWSAEQFHLPVPPGLTSTSSGLTLSTWDDVVPVYVQQTDRETLQAMVLLGQQGHCKVVMILRAEQAVEETEEEGDGCTPGSLNPKHNQDKHLGGVGREPSSPTHTRSLSPLLSNHEIDAGLAATPLKKRPPKARTVWKYHDLRVHHDPSEAWVSNLTKGWTLISDETTNRNTAPVVPAVGASDSMHHQLPTQPVTSQICGNKKDEDDDDDDDYWGQYGDADEEASSGDSSLGQDQACLDEVVENNNIESSPSLPKTLEEDSDSDSDDDYWGQYANNDNSSDRKNSGSHDNLAQSEDNGTSYRPEFAALQQQYDEARQQKERSDSLSTQVDPHMLSSILQMLVNIDSEDPAEHKHQQKEQDENIDEEEPANTRLLNEDIQEDSLSNISMLSSNQSSTQRGFNIKDEADSDLA
ncbi:hypothetical protein BGW42_000981 [Actinomortierella wolfii]|nr:hypothetical protein BGW42_000981 [Actinomortierella wolfii]